MVVHFPRERQVVSSTFVFGQLKVSMEPNHGSYGDNEQCCCSFKSMCSGMEIHIA